MKKSLIFFALIGLFSALLTYQTCAAADSPSAVMQQLYKIYKNGNYKDALQLTTGKEKKNVEKIMQVMANNGGRLPAKFENFVASVDDLKIIDENIQGNIARVNVLWIQKVAEKGSPDNVQVKVSEVAYLFNKVKDKWMVKSSRFLNQQVFYDYDSIQSIYKKMKPMAKTGGERIK